MNKAQQIALKRVYDRTPLGMSYLQFRRIATYDRLLECVMVEWCGMVLGIETDGYTHSEAGS